VGRQLVFGGEARVAIGSTDQPALEWLLEHFGPALAPAPPRSNGARDGSDDAQWRLELCASADAQAELRAHRPPVAGPRACFALDRDVIRLVTWQSGDRLVLDDQERSCLLRVGRGQLELFGDPATRRWRFSAVLALCEIFGAALGGGWLQLHAAGLQTPAGAVALIGPKGAGKTTLMLHLMRSEGWRPIANDRLFAGRGEDDFVMHGLPTPVKIRASTLADFPELGDGLVAVERPYLYTLAELASQHETRAAAGDELALTPAQVAARLGAEPVGSGPLRKLLFPEVRSDIEAVQLEAMDPDQVRDTIWRNLCGHPHERREATVFEELAGGRRMPPPELADALAESLPGHRLLLGRDCYADRDFADRFLAAVG